MSQTYEVGVRLNADGSGLVTQSKAGADALDRVSVSADKVTKSFGQTFTAWQNLAQATDDEAQAIAKLDSELEALLGRLDPAQRAVNQLNNAQGLLTRSVQSGLLSQQQYNTAMAQAREMYGQAADGSERAAAGADKGAFATAGARRELIVLGHEAISGNFSRMPGSFMVLAERASFSGGAILGVVAPVALLAAGAIAMAAAFAQGHKETEAMNNALAVTGSYAGLTRGSMDTLAATVSRAGMLTIGTSKEVVTAVVASGHYSADNVALLAGMVDNFAHATGATIDKITPELIKMFEDPAKASEALNAQYHYLNVAELERIRTLQNTGRSQEAVTVAVQALTAHLPDHAKNLGYVESAWEKAKKAASEYWDAAKGLGRDATPQDAVAQAQAGVTAARNLNATPGVMAEQSAALDLAQRQVAVNEKLAQIRATALQTQEKELAAQKEVEKSQTYQITQLEQMRAKVADAPDSADKARRLFEINKQIRDLRISMGAEGATMANQRIASELQLRDIALAMAGEQNDTALKLKQITQADHDATKTWLELQKNTMQQIAVQQQIAVGNMTAGQRQALELTLRRLQAEATAIQQKGTDQQAVDAYNLAKTQEALINEMIDGVNKLGDAETKRLTAAIAAQRLHNDEIGKTKDQIDRVKQAEQDAGTAKLQTEADAIAALLNEQGLNQQAVEIYTAMLVQLNAQIAARKELSSLIGDASIRQQQADYARAQSEEYKRLFNTVEQTGKTVFTHLLSDGKGAFESIGKALKASVIDLLYQLTVRPWIIQIGTSFAGQLGIQAGAGALGAGAGGAGSVFSAANLGSSIAKWAGFGGADAGSGAAAAAYAGAGQGSLVGVGSSLSASEMAALGYTGAEVGAGSGAAGLGLSGALGAIPGWGWAALGVGALLGGGALFGGGGGPKASDASLRRRANGAFGIEMNNVAGGDPDISQVMAMNAALNDPTRFDQAKLSGLVDTQIGTGSAADTATLISQLTAALAPAAVAARDMTTATTGLTAAEQAAAQADAQKQAAIATERQGLQDQLDQLTMTQAQLLDKQRNALDESNRSLFDQVQAATAAAAATQAEAAAKQKAEQEAAARATQIASERQGLQDQLDQLTMTQAQLLNKQRDALDESNRALFDQVQAANAAAAAAQAEAAAMAQAQQQAAATAQAEATAKAQADQQAANDAARIANERYSLETQLLQLQGETVTLRERELARLDASNRAIQEQIYATEDLTTVQQNQAASATALASAQSSLTSKQQSLESAVSALPAKLGIDALTKAQQGLATSDYVAPLDRVAAAKSLLDQTYQSGMGGDLAAVQAFPQQLQSALTIARDTFASGPQFQELFLDGNKKLNDLLTRQQSLQVDLLKDVPMTIQQASNDQIAAIREGFASLLAEWQSLRAELRRLAA